MNKKYRVVFLGLLGTEEIFRDRMSRLGVPNSTVKQIIEKAPVILKGGMSLGAARHYADAVQYAGGRVHIQEHGLFEETDLTPRSFDIKPFENFIMCPECGQKQLRQEACVRCGLPFDHSTTL